MAAYSISPQAQLDLEAIRAYLAETLPHRETETINDLYNAFDLLADYPGAGHRRQDLTRRLVYFLTVEPYVIVYRRGEDPLPILRVLHSARNLVKLLRRV